MYPKNKFLFFLKNKFIFSLLALFALVFLSSVVFADWDADIEPPALAISPDPGTYSEGRTITLSIRAEDPSGIGSLTVTASPAPLPTPTITNTPPSLIYTTYAYNWSPGAGTYTLTITTADTIGNAADPYTATYTIITGPTAWIQTTGGDVHSNTRINAPGGP